MKFETLFHVFLAVVSAIAVECWKKPFRRLLKIIKKNLDKQQLTKERRLHESEISNSVKSNYPGKVPRQYIVDQIKKHDALTTNKRIHYTDIEKRYHVFRKIEILPLIDGAETFFRELCREMSSSLNLGDTDFLFLSLRKETNDLFGQEFVGQNWPGRYKYQKIIYKERRRWIWSISKMKRFFDYGEVDSESLEGTKVILLEALLLFPETLITTVEWLKSQGATIVGIVILFDGSGSLFDFSTCITNPNNVIKGISVDLKIFPGDECMCNNKGLRVLTYSNY